MRPLPHRDLFGPAVALGDGLAGLRSLAPGSAGLVLSDLPSGETRAPTDRAPPLPEFWDAVWHALRDDGATVLGPVVALSPLLGVNARRHGTPRRKWRALASRLRSSSYRRGRVAPTCSHL